MQIDTDVQQVLLNQQSIIDQLTQENKLLREKVNFLLKKYFGGKKSESFDLNQLCFEAILEGSSKEDEVNEEARPSGKQKLPKPRNKKKDYTPKLPDDLLTEEIIIDPEEVKQNPEGYRCIGEERTEELDVITQKFFRRVIIRKKYVSIEANYRPPIIAPLAPRLIEKSIATPALLTEIMVNKYVNHSPLYRQEKYFLEMYGIHLSRKTMSDWMDKTAHWFESIYQNMVGEVTQCGYLQVDETPVRYLTRDGTQLGYFWVYRDPGGNVIYDWQTSRAHECLDRVLKNYKGLVHCDAYKAYDCYAGKNMDIILLKCLTHARRKFTEALDQQYRQAGWFVHQMNLLYAIEKRLRQQRAGPKYREIVRQIESQVILDRIYKALKIYLAKVKSKEKIGVAVHYTLRHWADLVKYVHYGNAEIDNNLVENAVRPVALGKKNWMFIGHEDAGQKSAVLYSVLESCRSYRINIREYLLDVLTRLPSAKSSQVKDLTPRNWAHARKSKAAA